LASGFFRLYWAADSHGEGRYAKLRLRVNDPDMSVHEEHWTRWETHANGQANLWVREDIPCLTSAGLYMELWGGHPGLGRKRFSFNGRRWNEIPDTGTEANQCAYIYPTVPFRAADLVDGVNSLQFTADRGTTFWGHYIVDNAAVRTGLADGHEDVGKLKLGSRRPRVVLEGSTAALGDSVRLRLEADAGLRQAIETVDYYAFYDGYDDNGSGSGRSWHGYTLNRIPRGHVGTSQQWPFVVAWDTRMIPTQDAPMEIKAMVRFLNGICYETEVLGGCAFPEDRPETRLCGCASMPHPFWTRAGQPQEASIEVPLDPRRIEKALLLARIWDGGEGNVADAFTLNGTAYGITSRFAVHDLVFSRQEVDAGRLRMGANAVRVLSDTEHHGIEVVLPGPALIVRARG
jgi:hypothetical protein